MSSLRSPGDKPSKFEEDAIATMKARETGKLDEIDGRLTKSSIRTVEYGKKGDVAALRTERGIQDRMLDERRAVMGLIGRHG